MRALREGKRLEWLVFCLFAVFYIVITVFHEPWFDEAQAWEIAKCASYREILFEIPHYEGHPPLWYLILSIPAKTGLPFEPSLKIIGFAISALSVYTILFKMSYPRLMRLMLPLSFFVFYQYGVIVRPYGLTLLFLLLLALEFPRRTTHPWRYTGLLMLLCLTSAYGIVLAGGIACCLLLEILREKGIGKLFAEALSDRRTLSLIALLAFAIALVLEIMPRDNTLVTSADRDNSIPLCLLCSLFTFMGECTLTTSSWFSVDNVLLQKVYMPRDELAAMCVIGAMLWLLCTMASSKRLLKYLLIPYGLFALFASVVYFGVHHVGVTLLLLLFWFGILFQDERRFEIGRGFVNRLRVSPRDRRLLKKTAAGIACACLAIPLLWTAQAIVREIQLDYSYGRTAACFIRENGLEEYNIMSEWGRNPSAPDKLDDPDNNVYSMGIPVLINAYFDRNICYNLNGGNDNEAYMHYQKATEAENAQVMEQWRSVGFPDVILGRPDLKVLFGNSLGYSDYTLIQKLELNYIWKMARYHAIIPVYLRNDLAEQLPIEALDDSIVEYMTDGLEITQEMKDAFENGVPVEEILKPYLDEMFGSET